VVGCHDLALGELTESPSQSFSKCEVNDGVGEDFFRYMFPDECFFGVRRCGRTGGMERSERLNSDLLYFFSKM